MNVIRVLCGEGVMCVKYMVYERGIEQGDIQNGKNDTEIGFVLINKEY